MNALAELSVPETCTQDEQSLFQILHRVFYRLDLGNYEIRQLATELAREYEGQMLLATEHVVQKIRRFSGEHVPSCVDYSNRFEVKTIQKQLEWIDQLQHDAKNPLPKFSLDVTPVQLQDKDEGLFLIPRWQEIEDSYPKAVLRLLKILSARRAGYFSNERPKCLAENRIRQTECSQETFKLLEAQQPGRSLLMASCELGKMYRGNSPFCAMEKMNGRRTAFDPFANAFLLITQPGRLINKKDLGMDCPGGECKKEDGKIEVPCFHFNKEGILCFSSRENKASEYFGTASISRPR